MHRHTMDYDGDKQNDICIYIFNRSSAKLKMEHSAWGLLGASYIRCLGWSPSQSGLLGCGAAPATYAVSDGVRASPDYSDAVRRQLHPLTRMDSESVRTTRVWPGASHIR